MALSLKLFVAALVTTITIASGVNAQTVPAPTREATYAAPVTWTRYNIPSQNLSFLMPKLPVVVEANDLCSQTEGASYTAYAEDSVYEFGWHAKSSQPIPKACERAARFGRVGYENRAAEFSAATDGVESEMTVMGSTARIFRSKTVSVTKTRLIVWDIERWFEMTITTRNSVNPNERRFLKSISIADSKGIAVGDGSPSILGDATIPTSKPGEAMADGKTQGIVIITKPRPGYTDAARTTNTQGTVIVRVTFLKNGGIGAVTAVKELENGLTEQAIAAAKKIAFLPARAGEVPQTVVKQVEYSFSIY